jgi:hypothetical protein
MRFQKRQHAFIAALSLAVSGGCDHSGPTQVASPPILAPQSSSVEWSSWSEPVNLGAPVNSPGLDQTPTLSKDGLHLYFGSNRPGGFGGNDLWVARRACRSCPWQTPVNLGPVVNSPLNEAGPDLSDDGRLLFFTSNRTGGLGLNDIYVSHRVRAYEHRNYHDDSMDNSIDVGLGWQAPVNLGPDVNTAAAEVLPDYFEHGGRYETLYFGRGPATNLMQDIYSAPVTRDGGTVGPAELVPELSTPFYEADTSVRRDAREVFFFSDRRGESVGYEIWTSTRKSVRDPWSAPVNPGGPLNSVSGIELSPSISFDGRTLVFISNRPGGVGGQDIWMSTRTHSDDDHQHRYH